VRFQVLTAASMMFRVVFWDILPCKMITRQYIPEDNSEQNYPVHASSSTPSHTNRLTIFMVGGEFIPYLSDREIYCIFVTTYYRPRWSSC
jgi:hypothetical protein